MKINRITSIIARYTLLLLIIHSGWNVWGQNRTADVFKSVAPSVVLIRTDQGGGTGFFISSTGMILTALHVVDGASRVSIKTQSGKVISDVSLISKDEKRDLALLKVKGSNFSSAEFSVDELSPGDSVIVLGNPLALEELEVTISTGIISGIRNLDRNTKILQITAPISPGNSGGPVLSESGKVVGVVSFKITKGESLNFAIPSSYAQELVGKASEKPLLSWSNDGKNPFKKSEGLSLPPKKSSLNLTGIWETTEKYSGYRPVRFLIKDDGRKVEVWWYPVGLNPELRYEGMWEGEFVLLLTDNFRGWRIAKPIDDRRFLWKGFRNEVKGDRAKGVKVALKKIKGLHGRSADDIWTKID